MSVKTMRPVKRRTSRRIPLQFPLWFWYPGHLDTPRKGLTQNVSASGLVFLTAEPLEVSNPLKISFENMPGDRQTRQIGAVICRTEYDDTTGQYLIGVNFTDLDEDNRTAITAALQKTDIMGLLRLTEKVGASDLHLSAYHPPFVRIAGRLRPLRKPSLSGPDLKDMIYSLFDESHRQVFERELELDFSLPITPTLRFRVNVHMQRGNVEAAFRRIEPSVRSFLELNLPEITRHFAELHDGLVLLTGPTGAGKTTTIAAMVEHINTTRTAVVITLENPIEYLHTYKQSVIKQREVGVDTLSYAMGLREAMRQDPDVIVIGEIRDAETMKVTLDAAETGHLVLATFPASNSAQSILRTYHFFPQNRQHEIQTQLASCLRGIMSLHLLPRVDQPGMIPATEVLTCTDAVAHLIRTNTLEQIPSAIQTGGRYGMHSLETSIAKLQAAGYI